ncbi:MAG: hypothetical protein LBR79_07070 [Oscillospiraceae bacterium]|nr:hypothetical protein [Oscillospiraceae bacterium]
MWVKIVEIPSFPPRHRRGGKILSINLNHYQNIMVLKLLNFVDLGYYIQNLR